MCTYQVKVVTVGQKLDVSSTTGQAVLEIHFIPTSKNYQVNAGHCGTSVSKLHAL